MSICRITFIFLFILRIMLCLVGFVLTKYRSELWKLSHRLWPGKPSLDSREGVSRLSYGLSGLLFLISAGFFRRRKEDRSVKLCTLESVIRGFLTAVCIFDMILRKGRI